MLLKFNGGKIRSTYIEERYGYFGLFYDDANPQMV